MNRFQVKKGREKDFEKIWKKRETRLDEVDGFEEFHLIKGETQENYTLYVSHSTWNSKEDFNEALEFIARLNPSPRDD